MKLNTDNHYFHNYFQQIETDEKIAVDLTNQKSNLFKNSKPSSAIEEHEYKLIYALQSS